jgi:hypothetical protein
MSLTNGNIIELPVDYHPAFTGSVVSSLQDAEIAELSAGVAAASRHLVATTVELFDALQRIPGARVTADWKHQQLARIERAVLTLVHLPEPDQPALPTPAELMQCSQQEEG